MEPSHLFPIVFVRKLTPKDINRIIKQGKNTKAAMNDSEDWIPAVMDDSEDRIPAVMDDSEDGIPAAIDDSKDR